MKQKIITTTLLVLLISAGFAQDDFRKSQIQDIRKKYSEIVKGEKHISETPKFQEADGCMPRITVKKKNNEIRMIEFVFQAEDLSYTKQYFFWNENLIFVYTQNNILAGTDDDGVRVIRTYEYRHYFVNGNCIKSMYKGFKYRLDEDPPVKNMEFFDYDKAYDERNNAQKYVEYENTNNWDKYCGSSR